MYETTSAGNADPGNNQVRKSPESTSAHINQLCSYLFTHNFTESVVLINKHDINKFTY